MERKKGKVKVKAKARAREDILFDRHICHYRTSTTAERIKKRKPSVEFAVERDIEQTIANSSYTQNQTPTARMATRQHLTNRANQAAVCFVLYEYSEDPDISAYMVGQNVPLPTEASEHVPLTPTASATVDMKNTANFNDLVMNDNDEPWATEADHRTGWNKTIKSGTYRGMMYGIVLRDYPKQVVSLAKAKSVATNMREFSSW